jgi:hypothetical protein
MFLLQEAFLNSWIDPKPVNFLSLPNCFYASALVLYARPADLFQSGYDF